MKTKKARDTRSEREIQIECVDFFRNKFPNQIIFAVSNENYAKNWFKFQPMGALAGVADLVVTLKDRVFFVEMKTATGVQSDNQRTFQWRCEALGIGYYLCRNLDDFKRAILAEWEKLKAAENAHINKNESGGI